MAVDRREVWSDRLRPPEAPDRCTFVADDGGAVVGFAHAFLDDDPLWGALLDNLHVAHTHQRRGVGARLLALVAGAVVSRRPSSGLYLWVLEQNVSAQAFYGAQGGRCVGRDHAPPPGWDPGRLVGTPAKLRYAWSRPADLLAGPASKV